MTDPGDVRIGDRERAQVDARLRAAHDDGVLTLVEYDERSRDCYAARFRRDLDALVADLPDAAPRAAPTVHAQAPEPSRVDTAKDPTPAPPAPPARRHRIGRFVPLAVLAVVVTVVGPGVLGADQGAAVFGSRTVTATSDPVTVGVLFGSTKVIVPDGTRADVSGTVVFGSTQCAQACSTALPPTAPRVAVRGRGAFGSVDVETVTEAATGGIDDHDDGDRDRDDD